MIETKKTKKRVAHFHLKNACLYKKGFSLLMLWCFYSNERDYALKELQERIC